MRSVPLATALVILLLCPCAAAAPAGPRLAELRLVARLPAGLPQRVTGFAYDGQKFWATLYTGRGRYATLDPSTLGWSVGDDETQHAAIRQAAGTFEAPAGICFMDDRLWVSGAYGDAFGAIDTRDWNVRRLFAGKQRNDSASQSYSSLACDGSHVWIAWHWFRYKLPVSETQLLLKVEPETGKVLAEYPLPAGTRKDMTHALAWDGGRLWHAKDSRLSSIDPATGTVTARYTLPQLKRPSGMAWDGEALWIAEFDGKVWRLPF